MWARRELIRRVSQKAYEYGITENEIADEDNVRINSKLLSDVERKQRNKLIEEIKHKGFNQVMEEVAYTWFNRFCALRFMEVNNYLPGYVKVFTDEKNNFNPLILKEAAHLDINIFNKEIVYEYLEDNKQDELYKYLIITQCNTLSKILPGMFQKIADYTELLFPDNLLREESVIGQMISNIPEEDWKDAVQIIGWLYQYYNTEPKDDVFAALKKNIKISKEKIPAATQLFTPDWIVRYMVENSLGRLWIEGHPDNELKSSWKYYLDEAEQEPEVKIQLDEMRKEYQKLKPEDIKIIDPCMGSGHILAYAFDVLMQIYESCGYSRKDAVHNILKYNLYGLDIDDRAAQLAYFSVMMKARQYDRSVFDPEIHLHVYSIQESNVIDSELINYFSKGNKNLKNDVEKLVSEMHDAKEYGSILNISKVDFDAIYSRFDEIKSEISLYKDSSLERLLLLVQIAEIISQKYDIVVTNPPYMGASNMNHKLNEFIKDNYADYKSDFFSAFVIRCSQMAKPMGYLGFFTPYVWMFIQSYEKMRQYLYNSATIETLIQFEYSAFEEATVPVCTFVFKNSHVIKKGCYSRLTDFRGGMEVQRQKALEAIKNHDCGYYFEQSTDRFSKIPGAPVAYWVSEAILDVFCKGISVSQIADVKRGMTTSDNDRFLRFWAEVSYVTICYNAESHEAAYASRARWFPYSKGGGYRKWYGYQEFVVDWENNGQRVIDYAKTINKSFTRTIVNIDYYFKPSVGFCYITTGPFSMRWIPQGFLYDSGGPGMFADEHTRIILLACMNSKPAQVILKLLNPTINLQIADIVRMPFLYNENMDKQICNLTYQNISLSHADWDSFETSWDFVKHPLIRNISTIKEAFAQWEQECDNRFNQLKSNEEELNRIFINIYGLQDELTPEVEDKDVTVRKADLTRDIKSLISYAVGCMFGRYSLDVEGLAYAGGEWDASKYSSFIPDKNNIIPILDDEYFQDDIVAYFVRFIETAYGESTLEENLRFIADALGGKGSSREVIRNYFMKDFYKDHCRIYQKRPIYWLFDSGKKDGFKALIYLHRYKPDIIARMRTEYVHEQQAKYQAAITSLENNLLDATPAERAKINKRLQKVKDQDAELLEFEEKIHHLADQMIKIDLDDGVKNNYELFKEVLANIK